MQHDYEHIFTSVISNYRHLNIELTQLDHVRVGQDWDYTLCDNFNRLYFVLDGEGDIYTGTGVIKIRPYHMYLIPAKFPFSCKCWTFLEKLYAHFKVTILPDRDLLSRLDHIVEFDSSREEIEAMKDMLYKGEVRSALYFRLKMEQLILDLIEPFNAEYSNDLSLYLRFEKFFSYTSSHPYADLTIEAICRHIDCTPRQLTYHYKTATGQTVKSYLNSLLLDRLRFLLQTTDRSVRDISEELHFSSEFYCSRFFKKHTGLSPREFRQQKN